MPNYYHYFIGDIHGMVPQLEDLLQKIKAHQKKYNVSKSTVVFLGDYVDRGKDSKKVIDRLIEYQKTEKSVIFLMGNHDEYFIETAGYNVNIDESDKFFIEHGGLETLKSFNFDANDMGKASEWLKNNCVYYYNHLNLVAVHAGIDWTKSMSDQKTDTLLYARNKFLSVKDIDYPFKIIHGHTITQSKKVEIYNHRIAVDTGAYYTGRLSCVVIETDKDLKTKVVDIIVSEMEPSDFIKDKINES